MSRVKFCIVNGMFPVNELKEKSSMLSWGEREAGITPEKLLCWRLRYWREGMERISKGRFPLRSLDRRLRTLRASSFPILLAGMGPESPTPGRWMAIIRVSFRLQEMPIQEVQTGALGFQLSLRP